MAAALRLVFTTVADEAAHQTQFVRRRSKLSGARFVQALTFGWLSQPDASLGQLTQMAATLGVPISPQGIDQRFSQRAALLLEQVLNAAVTQVVAADPVAIPLLRRFSAVTVQDSSTIALPAALAERWQGCGGKVGQGEAALKIQVRLDLLGGRLEGPLLEPGRSADGASPLQQEPLPAGALRLADLGYFSLEVLGNLSTQGVYWLSYWKVGTTVYNEHGTRLDLKALLTAHTGSRRDWSVSLGARQRLPARLLAVRVPPVVAAERRRKLRAEGRRKGQAVSQTRLTLADWTILVTNVPAHLLTCDEALTVVRARWQVELLFKLWKQQGRVDEWRSTQPWRILCEVYAKLLGLVVQHWLLLTGCWSRADRSLVKAGQTVRSAVMLLASAFAGVLELEAAIWHLAQTIGMGCRMNPRKAHPNTYQLLLALEEVA